MISNGKYRHTYTSTASDITPLYRLTPNAMLMYFQDSFARLMTIHNVAAFDIVKQRRMWVITEIQMDIQPTVTFWSEDFTVELWVSELTSLRIYCDFRIVRKDNEQLISIMFFLMLINPIHRIANHNGDKWHAWEIVIDKCTSGYTSPR